ncbi:GNAT family N-acetyltransferase [Stutzerimonas kirkiae]|uniref:GNAT family N-acetyltransferase n=1 Tax=Stutzerimonas kirkiae TaxID=2211392 RepID=A0A4Q9RDL7_9GAMM|nr:GNAT family N-acetyltransferase [Stutzerimonas kirkiae]TBU99813.1 GNAT family N-acetyltransferase [Stutzerimonas kirkiae]TBV05255.1 GNAT family N-acetyltransferase [Stutzerimonas kirkiae]TBV11689.1 GNAT family N-acetyltransferase [Stutzerimonas kirkiae]TBV15383.1 GNAT family N-acetyltransferase [Stutzerimonas kirkiae]
MSIRKLGPADLDAASALCMAAFMDAVAPTLNERGIQTFTRIAAPEAFAERMRGDNLILVLEDAGELQGLVELKEGRHLAMLFVAPERQRQGIGGRLLAAILKQVRSDLLTVNASLTSVAAYRRHGFECSGEIAELSGLVYQPMEKPLPGEKTDTP